jgi:hypothetical protein
LFDGKIAGLGAAKDLVDLPGDLVVEVRWRRTVRDNPSLALGTTPLSGINDLGGFGGAYGTTFV